MAGYREDWFNNNESNHGWYTCVRCGKKLRKGDVDVDHIIPQNKGGRHDLGIDNVRDYGRNVRKNTSKKVESLFGRKKR